jgi:hypothetical protein
MMISLRQAAKLHGCTVQYLSRLCRDGRIPGAVREPLIGMWVVPSDFTVDKLPKKGARS